MVDHSVPLLKLVQVVVLVVVLTFLQFEIDTGFVHAFGISVVLVVPVAVEMLTMNFTFVDGRKDWVF